MARRPGEVGRESLGRDGPEDVAHLHHVDDRLLAVTGHVAKAVVLAVWGSVVIGMADNLLRPWLVGDRAQMHELIIFFSVLGGLQFFGVLGILLGPVVVAIGLALLEAFRAADASVTAAEAVTVEPAPRDTVAS